MDEMTCLARSMPRPIAVGPAASTLASTAGARERALLVPSILRDGTTAIFLAIAWTETLLRRWVIGGFKRRSSRRRSASMICIHRPIGLRTVACAAMMSIASAPVPTLACGFHDPTSVQRGVLNFVYPDALHVSGAVWALQKDGRLPMPDAARVTASGEARKRLDMEAYWRASLDLVALGSEMERRRTTAHTAAIVLLGPMLWTRFEGAAPPSEMIVDVDAPGRADGDLVAVTDTPVLLAIAAGEMTVSEAIDLGAMRLYGTDAQLDAFVADFGGIGATPAPRPSARETAGLFLAARAAQASPDRTDAAPKETPLGN